MTDLNKIINEQRERIAELQQENTLLLAKTLPECNCEGLQQRIAELETELDKAYNDLANFEGYPEEVSALRHDIERRKQRYKNILLDRAEWKKRAEEAEKRLAEVDQAYKESFEQAIELLITGLNEPEQITECEVHDLITVRNELRGVGKPTTPTTKRG